MGKHIMVWTLCSRCKKPVRRRKSDIMRRGHHHCFSCANRLKKKPCQNGPKNPKWRGGITLHTKGYKYEYAPDHPAASNGYVLQHRLIAEKKLGRHLRPEEVVHHKDGNKANNHPDNVEVFAGPGEHSAHHWKIRLKQATG